MVVATGLKIKVSDNKALDLNYNIVQCYQIIHEDNQPFYTLHFSNNEGLLFDEVWLAISMCNFENYVVGLCFFAALKMYGLQL